MKKVVLAILCLALLAGMAIPVSAASMQVYYTGSDTYAVGDTVSVDTESTLRSIMQDPGCTSDAYNAALERNVSYTWFRNDSPYAEGPYITLTEADKGCSFHCVVYLYNDAFLTDQCSALVGPGFTVANTENPAFDPTITTATIPNGMVGESYYKQLLSKEPEATFSLFRSSLPDGLTLSSDGVISGTPTKAGFWYVVIMASFGGVEATNEYEITIGEPSAQEEYTLEVMQGPTKDTYTAGETVDMTGLRVRIYTPDGYIDSKDGDKLTYSTDPLSTTGDVKIKLGYKDAFTFIYIMVKPAPTETTAATEATSEPTISVVEVTLPTEEVLLPTEGHIHEVAPESASKSKIAFNLGALPLLLVIVIIAVAALIPIALVIVVIVVVIIIVKKRKKAKAPAQEQEQAQEAEQ